MTKIVLLCAAGMSTSLLVTKMKAYSEKQGYDYTISAHPISEVQSKAGDASCILLGPQVRFELESIQKKMSGIPVEAVDMMAYGMMDGAKVITQARKLMGED
ncbi:PTS sugar transporter subunit IIB [Fusibacter ferrireducens]|uniref:PTS sugar transporter subunit IIB n=1 Tax=Fusibacter ferrireducens TaxID=2785058 RepID=A0ABS0A0J5_9FIRM|nr:PTS sugar transporter subunit IIB [Fusibacter ferrireducens]MBF4695670.1 PTS sugar transporter subunit IIB [Fusibacter ferrireducens]